MTDLKLARLPCGTNRNRSPRRENAAQALAITDVELLFRRFWQVWRSHMPRKDVHTAADVDQLVPGGA